MDTIGNKYIGQITAILHHINMMVQCDWRNSDINAFENTTTIEALAKISGMSKRNLHIYFAAYTNETVGQYKNRIRLEYALQLLKEGKYTQSEIAARIGLANDTALYNIFRRKLNTTPANYKARFLIEPVIIEVPDIDCKIVDLPETPVLFLSHIGNYNDYASAIFEKDSWDKLYGYALKNNLLPEIEEYWGICYDDVGITDTERCRFYACMTIARPIKSRLTDEVKCMTLPIHKYAVYTHKGSYSELDSFYKAILLNIPSGYILGEGLILERYLNSPNDINESELVTEILLPIAKVK